MLSLLQNVFVPSSVLYNYSLKYQTEVKVQQQEADTDSKTIICLFFVPLAIFFHAQ